MNQLLINFILKNKKSTRKNIGYISAATGAICNLFLFIIKLTVGLIVNSISITADAFNNLSDLGTNIVSFIGFTFADKPADKDHPFGHGRFEYVSAMIISIIILIFSYELIKTSFARVLNPTPVVFRWYIVIILIVSILIKLWMALFNKTLNKKIASYNLNAIFIDSVADVMATSLVLLSFILAGHVSFPVDGFAGILVGLFIAYNGIQIFKDTLNSLIGPPPKTEFYDELINHIKSFDHITGVHDLIIHDYGPETKLSTIHVEMASTFTFSEAHNIIDAIENSVKESFGIELVIHVDPVQDHNNQTFLFQHILDTIKSDYSSILNIHDFRIVNERGKKVVIFDVLVQDTMTNFDIKKLRKEILQRFHHHCPDYRVIINIEKEDTFVYQ